MRSQRNQSVKLFNIALICMLPLFAGCEEEKNSDCNFIDFVTSACLNRVIENVLTGGGSGGGSGGSTSGGGGSDTGGLGQPIGISVIGASEYEPNNTIDNANLLQFPNVPGDRRAGISVTGTVHDSSDVADFFVLTPNRSATYRIYIRAGNCSCAASADSVYLMVYDQSQTTIASTTIGVDEPLWFEIDLTAGLAYYIEVNGYETYSVHYVYELNIEELE